MKIPQIAHIDELVRVTEGAAVSGRDAIILESWLRCISDHKLDPAVLREAYIVPSEQLRPQRDALEEFLRTARFGLESLYQKVAGLGYVLLLINAQGVTVDFIGDRALDGHLRRAGLYLGADWHEQRAGTCAGGTCLATGSALTVHQGDHFDATHMPLTCTAAPIFDCQGRIAAVLDISALQSPEAKDSQSLALQLVKWYAACIENTHLLNSFRREWIVKFSSSPEFVDVAPDCILALNSGGHIIGFNHSAQELLTTELGTDWRDNSVLLGKPFNDFFECDFDTLPTFVHSRPAEQRTLRLKRSELALFAQTLLPPSGFSSRSADTGETTIPEPLRSVGGDDPALRSLLTRAAKLVNTRMSLLIQGETGTGKEHLAKALHLASVRADKPFVAVNCAALPETLIESELFGYEAGSFTGAKAKGKRGLIAEAEGGTLFLDEIGDMPLSAQTRLLRVLAEREVTPLGRTKPIPVDVRFIAATHRDLVDCVKASQFRDDLYFRLSGAVLTVPPLRQRTDLEWLIEKVLQICGEREKSRYFLTEPARTALCAYSWPGNIRELINCMEYACAVCDEGVIRLLDLPEHLQSLDSADTKPELLEEDAPPIEGERLRKALKHHHWNITSVARELGIHRSTVYRQMQHYGIPIRRG